LPATLSKTRNPNLTRLLANVLRCRAEAEQLRAALDKANGRLQQAESLLLDRMRALHLTSFQDAAGNRATSGEWLWASPTDEAALFRWLRARGHGDLIKRSVHGQSLSALIRQLKAADKTIPGCVHVTTRPKLLVRRA